MKFWVGGYGSDHDGAPAEGIGVLTAGDADDALAGGPLAFRGTAVAAPSPSWVGAHPSLDVVYATLEERGEVQAYRRTGESTFARLGEPFAAGAALCHVAVAPDGTALVTSSWGEGRVTRLPLAADGTPHGVQVARTGTDPYAAGATPAAAEDDLDLAAAARALREAAGDEYAHLVPDHDRPADVAAPESSDEARPSRAHQSRFLPGGLVATTDLGWDVVRIWRNTAEGLQPVQRVTLPQGSGPRHTVWHPSGHLYVVTELSREVFVLAPDAEGVWRLIGGVSAAPGTLDGDTAAELTMSHDGGFVYAGIRGSNTIGVLRVRGAGEALEPVALVEAGVVKPRHHVVVRDTLVVAGQGSDEVASLTLDIRTGIPGRVRHRTPVPAPTCLLPVR